MEETGVRGPSPNPAERCCVDPEELQPQSFVAEGDRWTAQKSQSTRPQDPEAGASAYQQCGQVRPDKCGWLAEVIHEQRSCRQLDEVVKPTERHIAEAEAEPAGSCEVVDEESPTTSDDYELPSRRRIDPKASHVGRAVPHCCVAPVDL